MKKAGIKPDNKLSEERNFMTQWLASASNKVVDSDSSSTTAASDGTLHSAASTERTSIDVAHKSSPTSHDGSALTEKSAIDGSLQSVSTSQSHDLGGSTSDTFMFHFHKDGRHYIRCKACHECPEAVRLFARNRKLPPIAQEDGTIFRKATINEHLNAVYHKEAVKAYKIKSLSRSESAVAGSIGLAISKANEALSNKIGGLIMQVYNDAKQLTLAAYSFPSRALVSDLSNSFKFSADMNTDDTNLSLQYLTPNNHRDFLECIIECEKNEFSEKVANSLAISLRCDGSVDRTQIDKQFLLLKVVNRAGDEELYFLGAAEPDERGAKGMYNAIEEAITATLGDREMKELLPAISSFVTDGCSANTGNKGGLWTLMKKAREDASDEIMSPLLTIWCVAHRSNLAWKSVSDTVKEVSHIFQQLVSICSFFHQSGLRSRELRDIASEHHLNLVRLPKVFEVRWTQFTFDMLNAILTSWHALVLFFDKTEDRSARGFLQFLTNIDNLEIMALLADVLLVFSRFQKNIQSDTVTITDMDRLVDNVKAKIKSLKVTPLVGGWLSSLRSQMERDESDKNDNGSGIHLKGIELQQRPCRRRKEHHKFVTDHRDSVAVVNEIIESLVEFLTQRFSIDENVTSVLNPFAKLEPKANLSEVHKVLCADLDLAELGLEYDEVLHLPNIDVVRKKSLSEIVKLFLQSEHYMNVATTLARILAAKPHSADVERLISASNNLKSPGRSSMNLQTENMYLFVHYNLPPLLSWNPRNAVLHWLTRKQHRVRERPQAKTQPYFRGLFPVSQLDEQEEDSEEEEVHSNSKKMKQKKF